MSPYERIRRLIAGEAGLGRTPAERIVLNDLGYTLLWLALVIGVAVIAVVVLAFARSPLAAAALIGNCGLTALAAGAVGGMLGFLFGIPRTLADDGEGSAGAAGERRSIRSNTNLEQVSDWLTKIVIGATLVEIKEIGNTLVSIGQFVERQATQMSGQSELTGLGAVIILVIVIFAAAGFLTLYLQTRTFLSILVARTEHVMGDPTLRSAEVDALFEATRKISIDGVNADIPSSTRELARRALDLAAPPEANVEILKQRGYAQVVLGMISEGTELLKRVYERTGDEELRRIVSRLLARSRRPGEAKDLLGPVTVPTAPNQLSEAETDALLTRMFVSLYEPRPLGYTEALRIGASLQSQDIAMNSPKRKARLSVYMAAAYGQYYDFSRGDPSIDRTTIRQNALNAVRDAIEADPSTRSTLQNMLEGDGDDDDLVVFKGDPEFRQLVL